MVSRVVLQYIEVSLFLLVWSLIMFTYLALPVSYVQYILHSIIFYCILVYAILTVLVHIFIYS